MTPCLPVCLSICLPVCVSVCVTPCLPACLSACLPVCLPACLPICLSVCLPVRLSACLPVCPPNQYVCRSLRSGRLRLSSGRLRLSSLPELHTACLRHCCGYPLPRSQFMLPDTCIPHLRTRLSAFHAYSSVDAAFYGAVG